VGESIELARKPHLEVNVVLRAVWWWVAMFVLFGMGSCLGATIIVFTKTEDSLISARAWLVPLISAVGIGLGCGVGLLGAVLLMVCRISDQIEDLKKMRQPDYEEAEEE
jgi:hypothetical protein